MDENGPIVNKENNSNDIINVIDENAHLYSGCAFSRNLGLQFECLFDCKVLIYIAFSKVEAFILENPIIPIKEDLKDIKIFRALVCQCKF